VGFFYAHWTMPGIAAEYNKTYSLLNVSTGFAPAALRIEPVVVINPAPNISIAHKTTGKSLTVM
ncbi:MAG: hypothetical protein KDD06_04580, partial [Phaeodactylibacter sp.]|nr:hypothetical protein [Phaeodactylibacter sp.]